MLQNIRDFKESLNNKKESGGWEIYRIGRSKLSKDYVYFRLTRSSKKRCDANLLYLYLGRNICEICEWDEKTRLYILTNDDYPNLIKLKKINDPNGRKISFSNKSNVGSLQTSFCNYFNLISDITSPVCFSIEDDYSVVTIDLTKPVLI